MIELSSALRMNHFEAGDTDVTGTMTILIIVAGGDGDWSKSAAAGAH